MKATNANTVGDGGKDYTITSRNFEIIEVGGNFANITGYSECELLEMRLPELLANPTFSLGRQFERLCFGEHRQIDVDLMGPDKELTQTKLRCEKAVRGGITQILITVEESEDLTLNFEDYDVDDETESVGIWDTMETVTFESPSGEMKLRDLADDLETGQNEHRKYRKGALSLHQAVDERLQEELDGEQDTMTIAALKEMKARTAHLYQMYQC